MCSMLFDKLVLCRNRKDIWKIGLIMSRMLRIKGLTKRFGQFTAVEDISFSVQTGEVLGFLGPNGAGKSTTMKMVTGFLPPSSGTAIVCGSDVTSDPISVKRNIGYLPEGAPLYEDMTPAGLLSFVADVRGILPAERPALIDRAVDKLQLDGVYHQQIGTLSKGFKRRVGFAQAILHDPDVLILDEPTDGLDPNQKHQVRELISEMSKDKAIVISTHLLEEVNAVCSRAMVISQGKKVADGTPGELEKRSSYFNAVSIFLRSSDVESIEKALVGIKDIDRIETKMYRRGMRQVVVFPKDGANILNNVSDTVRKKKIPIEQLYAERGRLDEVFRQITGDTKGGVA